MITRAIVFSLLALGACRSHAFGVEEANAPDGDNPPLQLRIWYPTQGADVDTVYGKQLPMIVISHGVGGALESNEDTAAALAEAGFVAVAVLHTGNNYRDHSQVRADLRPRPRHISRTLDYMLTTWRGHSQLDANRIGMFGFSAGGFAALVVSGGEPDLTATARLCGEQPNGWTCRSAVAEPLQA